MMIRSTSVQRAALLAALLAAPGLYAAEVAGVKVDDRIQVGSHALVLNGAGLRSKFCTCKVRRHSRQAKPVVTSGMNPLRNTTTRCPSGGVGCL